MSESDSDPASASSPVSIRKRTWFGPIEFVVVILIITALIALLVPEVKQASSGASRHKCRSNLMAIALALHGYHEKYGSFPPAYIADATGRPRHSWRVLILPFLDRQQLYDEYRFDEPWNGPHNSMLSQRIGEIFNCPSEMRLQHREMSVTTSYLPVIGPNTMWPNDKAVKLDDVPDGTSNTIMVAEVANSGIHWMEPSDLDVKQMAATVNRPSEPGISSAHAKGAHVVFVDGHAWFLSEELSADTIHALLTRNGGETVGEF